MNYDFYDLYDCYDFLDCFVPRNDVKREKKGCRFLKSLAWGIALRSVGVRFTSLRAVRYERRGNPEKLSKLSILLFVWFAWFVVKNNPKNL